MELKRAYASGINIEYNPFNLYLRSLSVVRAIIGLCYHCLNYNGPPRDENVNQTTHLRPLSYPDCKLFI